MATLTSSEGFEMMMYSFRRVIASLRMPMFEDVKDFGAVVLQEAIAISFKARRCRYRRRTRRSLHVVNGGATLCRSLRNHR